MELQKINFDKSLSIWKTKLNLNSYKSNFLQKSYGIINNNPHVVTDGYSYNLHIKNGYNSDKITFTISDTNEIFISNKMDSIVKTSIDFIKKINKEETNVTYWNMIHSDVWINRVRSKNPVQDGFSAEGDERYHTHTDINEHRQMYFPHYTFVYYIQMPDIMNNDDGFLYLQNKNRDTFSIKPEEDDLIIMESWVPHMATAAPNATIDRIVLAGNVGFDAIKKQKTLL
jgi:hypothetical protein